MKKFNLMILIVSTLLFVACGDDAKEAAKAATNSVAEASTKAVDATKEAASKAVDATAEAAVAAKEKAAKMAEEAKAAAEKAAADVKAKAKEAATAAKEKAAKMAEETKAKAEEVAAAAKAKTEEMAKAAEDKAAEVKEKVAEAVTPKVNTAAGAALFGKCAGCHGKDGKTKALGKSAVIAGQDAATLTASIKGYKAGTRNVSGMGTLMKGQVASMSDSDIEAVAAYISTLK